MITIYAFYFTDELFHEKEKIKDIADDLDATFAEFLSA